MSTATVTKPSTRKLSEVARVLAYPSGIVKSAWPRIEHRLATMGITYDPWQVSVAKLSLGRTKDDKYASTVSGVTLSIPRQVGKTFTVGSLIVALCIEYPGLKVLWTAHRTRTATDTFQSMQGMVRRKAVKPLLKANRSDGIRTANGEQEIEFANGSKIMFGARADGFGRGFTEVDIEVFDEAQNLHPRALADMAPAVNQSKHKHGGLIFYMGTPPKPGDQSEMFALKRDRAISKKLKTGVYVEFSADPDSDPDDRSQWPLMNPSFPHRTPVEAMERMRENLPSDDDWNREARGIWDPVQTGGVILASPWMLAQDDHSVAVERFALGVEVAPGLEYASIVMAGQRSDDDWHIELVEGRLSRGVSVLGEDDPRTESAIDWLVPSIERYVKKNPGMFRAVVVDIGGPLATLVEQRGKHWYFKGSKIRVAPLRVRELEVTCSLLVDGVNTGTVRHIGQPQLSAAALAAGKKEIANRGMWVWSRKSAESDITPIQAATYALFGAQTDNKKVPTPETGSGSQREAVVLGG